MSQEIKESYGDMKTLEVRGRRHKKRLVLVECQECGHIRETQLDSLRNNKGVTHSIKNCKGDYIQKEYLGKNFGDYECIGVGECNTIKIRCKFCEKEYEVSECSLHERKHSPITCKDNFYEWLKGKEYNGFQVVDIVGRGTKRKITLKCLKCGTERIIYYQREDSILNCSHENCIEHLPNDKTKEIITQRYHNIIARTTNPNNTNYHNYGGRGIECHFEDIVDFYYHFYEDLKSNPNLTIDRIDVDGHYSKENTRLISHHEQQSNKKNTRYFLAFKNGKTVLSNNSMEFGRRYGANGRSVGNCLRGTSKSASGWIFKNITKEEFETIHSSVTTKCDNDIIVVQEIQGEIPCFVAPPTM